jgi:hypothetical protein
VLKHQKTLVQLEGSQALRLEDSNDAALSRDVAALNLVGSTAHAPSAPTVIQSVVKKKRIKKPVVSNASIPLRFLQEQRPTDMIQKSLPA